MRDHLRRLPHWVYRIYDSNDALLYVGCTSKEPRDRIVQLRGENPIVMAAPLHHWEADQYDNGQIAETIEGRLIDQLQPPLNRHRSGVWERIFVVPGPYLPIRTSSGVVPPKGRWPQEVAS